MIISQQEYESKTVATSQGWTIAELRRWFDRVANPSNWKLPVDATLPTISEAEKQQIAAAVEFFTASATSITETPDGCRVQAPGYYEAVGA